ncbi:MAG: hypothetical protein NZ551_01440 [Microscillaceae bacterium]|nr:hypothetical protein [Microscillaceae bacterium]MDW8459852.1 hypothetical protein [Cytophagales bacterium]
MKLFFLWLNVALIIHVNRSIAQVNNGAEDFLQKYAQSYQETLAFLKENKTLTQKILCAYHKDWRFVLALAFPEMIRYNETQNFYETASLSLLYIRWGTDYANFSVGRLQMKPSFAEIVEQEIIKYNLIPQYKALLFSKNISATEQRQIRIQRLNDWKFQLLYLAAFVSLIEKKFALYLQNYSVLQKLTFCASAYNLGLQYSAEIIERWATTAAFPYGKNSRTCRYNYTQIALFFYQNIHF